METATAPSAGVSELRNDPITFEVLRNAFKSICNEASALIERVSYAPTITEGHDYSVSILTPGRPPRLARPARPGAAHGHLRVLGAEPRQGGHRVRARATPSSTTTPTPGGTHQNDVKIIRPIFCERRAVRVRDRPLPLARRRRADARHLQPARDRVLRRGAADAAAEAVRERRAGEADLGPDRDEHPGAEGARRRDARAAPRRRPGRGAPARLRREVRTSRSSATASRTRWTTPSAASASGSAGFPTAAYEFDDWGDRDLGQGGRAPDQGSPAR